MVCVNGGEMKYRSELGVKSYAGSIILKINAIEKIFIFKNVLQ